MSIVGLYSKIQYLETVVNDIKNTQSAFVGPVGSVDASGGAQEKAIDLTQLDDFNDLSEKVKALEVVDDELSKKIAEVPSLLLSYVSATEFSALNAKVDKIDKLNSQMDKLNSKLDSLISKVSSLESKVSTLESQTPA